ncbi:DNA recombination protein RmuC [Arboricoccus pini]|uniref:DNA recombination protein RmuC homolog n=1 Tax=Arboricoccus pini TaxID=1963835 RepID=A0A212QPV0_9PROT|nr:DNA recombination protein RmuC [Arboricoccus pini]SNB61463.1 DNA recombination protein RmuC [Arboricoccus pini]
MIVLGLNTATAGGLAFLLGTVFLLGALLGGLSVGIWRRSVAARSRAMLMEAERQRQAETEALLDGVKLAFGDISLNTFARLAEQLGQQTSTALSSERRLQSHQQAAERGELDARLRTVLEQMERMRQLVQQLERDREGKFAKLEAELRTAGERAQALIATTHQLGRTLASARARGQWGERLAEDVLRGAGLVEGISFRRQQAAEDGRRPDFTILLPGDYRLNIDVKFPFDNYQKSQDAPEADVRARAAQAFIRDVRARIAEVAGRNYIAPEEGTLDLAILFIPNERVFEVIAETAPQLFDEALAKRVVLAAPLTLFAVLSVIRQTSGALEVGRNARELADAILAFRTAWDAYDQEALLAERKLDEAMKAMRGLNAGRRDLLGRRIDDLDRLSARR